MPKLTKRPVKRTATPKSRRKSSLMASSHFSSSKATFFIIAIALTGIAVIYSTFASSGEPKLEKFKNNLAKGWVWDDLEVAPAGSPCRGLLVSKSHKKDKGAATSCTHGPDPAPVGVDVRRSVEPVRTGEDDKTASAVPGVAYASTSPTPAVPCEGDGQSGNRVQFVYVHAADKPDRYAAFAQSFQIWAANTDNAFSESAAQTGGVRHLRIVTDANCQALIPSVTISSTGDDVWSNTWSELKAQGYNRTDRKYVLFEDATVYCGIGDVLNDDRAISTNLNNAGPSFARVDSGCWGRASLSQASEAHELMHNIGGVQLSAPHTTNGWHCTDESDQMCYTDAAGVTMTYVCPGVEEAHFDCNKDDYFNTNAASGSYLATHWNTANSLYLTTLNNLVPLPPPPSGCTPGPDYAVIYSAANYGGTCKTLALGYAYPLQSDLNPVPHIYSAIVGANIKLTLCWSSNFAPVCDPYIADAPTLVHPGSSQSALIESRTDKFTAPPVAPPPPATDSTPPVAKITQPSSGAVIGNSTPVSGSATDNVGVTRMELYIDGQLKSSTSTGTVSYNWSSRKASRGSHTITVKAFDKAGNVGQSTVNVTK